MYLNSVLLAFFESFSFTLIYLAITSLQSVEKRSNQST